MTANPNLKWRRRAWRGIALTGAGSATVLFMLGSPAAWGAGQATAVSNLPIATPGRHKAHNKNKSAAEAGKGKSAAKDDDSGSSNPAAPAIK